ncbi:MAG: hypothetical protein JWN04_2706 [Myxococcaceae bacterium]|nr:hypothetical protein [Myxococcaceae bacterium]
MKVFRWFSLCVLCQCTGTETGNPVCDENLRVGFSPLTATVARPDGDISFSSVAIEVASVSLEPCAGSEATVLLQNRPVDLFMVDVNEVHIPAGSYCAMVIDMGSSGDSFAAGRQVSNGQINLTFDSQLRVRARLPLRHALVTNGSQPNWILGVDLAQWLHPIDSWLKSGPSQLTLNGPQATALRQAQASSLRLYQDVDDDGQLDAADIAAPLSDVGVILP